MAKKKKSVEPLRPANLVQYPKMKRTIEPMKRMTRTIKPMPKKK